MPESQIYYWSFSSTQIPITSHPCLLLYTVYPRHLPTVPLGRSSFLGDKLSSSLDFPGGAFLSTHKRNTPKAFRQLMDQFFTCPLQMGLVPAGAATDGFEAMTGHGQVSGRRSHICGEDTEYWTVCKKSFCNEDHWDSVGIKSNFRHSNSSKWYLKKSNH